MAAPERHDRAHYLALDDSLIVLAPTAAPDAAAALYVVVDATGGVTAFNGHVDLGTGIRTALAQVVAEELDVAFARVHMVLGDTATGPDQGPTVASITMQVTAVPLRAAAAQARSCLVQRAADQLGVPVARLLVEDGVVRVAGENRFVSYGDLLRGQRLRLTLDAHTPVRAPSEYRVVGRSVPRVDLPAKATGGLVYVHDMRLPGMVHGRVVRPPYAGIDAGEWVGRSLIGVDESSLAGIPGLLATVVIGDFVGVVAEREEHAALAAERLKVTWRPGPTLPDLDDLQGAISANPATPRTLLDQGDVDAAIAAAATPLARRYVWPYQLHASLGPSCALAEYREGGLRLWSGTQNPHALRDDLARLLALSADRIDVIRMEAAGCYGRNCADDVSADAALLSRAVGRPVRVQLTRAQEHAWEPKGSAQLIDVRGGLDAAGHVAAYDFRTSYPSNRAPTLALILTGTIPATAEVGDVGDRTAIPPYAFDAIRVVVNDMPPIVRAAWMRGVSALPNTFAHESYIDELAIAAGVDPVEYRLRYLHDPRAIDLVRATAERAGWQPRTTARRHTGADGLLHGQGFAYALYVHSKFPGFGAAWSAWVADVAVDPASGEVSVERIVAGQDTGLLINPDGVRHQLHGNVIQSISRTLNEQVRFDRNGVTTREWGAYPITTFPEVPPIETLLMQRPDQPPVGAGESASVPSAAAIANAIFDATGVRFRAPPFTPERIRAGLHAAAAPPARPRARRLRDFLAGAATVAAGLLGAAVLWHGAIPPAEPLARGSFAAATLTRGGELAALGNCALCHTAADGAPFAGGRRIDTPFGAIVTPNITPDPDSGIGVWSLAAFTRALRRGIHRDGHLLYPAMPYPEFTRLSDGDLQALYAFLMAAPPVRTAPVANALRWPFSIRPLLAGWNALFLDPRTFRPDPAQSSAWNRGAYLVQGIGHCGGCHSPRNALGAAARGGQALAGGWAEGWEAPALTHASPAPVPWSEAELYAYLRTGYAPLHGPAAGPMGSIVAALAVVPDADIRAMAVYLASLQPAAAGATPQTLAARLQADTASAGQGVGARLYEGACAVCHQPGRGPVLFGVKPSLALNSNVHSAAPDNLIRTILDGIARPVAAEHGTMPGFRTSLDDAQIAELAGYIRRHFAPDQPAWPALAQAARRLRAGS